VDVSNAWTIASYAAAGIALAACAGMRAFLPLLVIGIAGRLGRFEISEGYQWLLSDAALITFAVAAIAETLADKIPAVDHALDAVQLFIKPVVGTIAAAALFVHLPPLEATLLGLVVGGTVATGVGLAKAKVRLLSSLTTGTMLNPVVSLVEDVVSAVVAAIAVLVPVLALACIVGIVVWGARRLHRKLQPPAPTIRPDRGAPA
jgi:hypothetical protein